MKKILFALLLLLIVAAAVLKIRSNKKTVEANIYQHDPNIAVPVSVVEVVSGAMNNSAAYMGLFEPQREGKIMAETQGKVILVPIEEGAAVKTGQTLARLDNQLLRLQLEALEVQIEGLEKDINRYTILDKADAIQGVQLEKTVLAHKAAAVQKRTLEEQIRRTVITASYPGIVTLKMVEPGAVLNPGQPVAQITDISSLKLAINVPEQEIGQFRVGQRYEVGTDVHPGAQLEGKVVLVGSKGDVSHQYIVQLLVANSSKFPLKVGMYGVVKTPNRAARQVLLIPQNALTGASGKSQVFVLKDGKAVLKDVKTGVSDAQNVEIIEGLQTGEKVVVSGQINLRDGVAAVAR